MIAHACVCVGWSGLFFCIRVYACLWCVSLCMIVCDCVCLCMFVYVCVGVCVCLGVFASVGGLSCMWVCMYVLVYG